MKPSRLISGPLLGVVLATAVGTYVYQQSAASDEHAQHLDGNFDLGQTSDFNEFPLYSLGDSFEGLPLTAVHRAVGDISPAGFQENFVQFVYGDCQTTNDTGCTPPLAIQVWPACERNPSLYALTPNGEPFPHRDVVERGVPAAFYAGDTILELYSGDVTIALFSEDRRLLQRAARALAPANGLANAEARSGNDLPAPAAGALAGELSC
jgi:hypothetical protein